MLAALTCCARMLRHPDPLTCPWHRLTYAHTAALRAELARRYAPSTANRHLAALRGVLRECRRLGLMSADACAAAGDVDPVRGRRLPAGRALEAGEIAAVLGTCAADASPAGRRDAALIAVAYGAGLRRAEVVTLTLADYQVADASLRVRRGKGNVERLAYLGADWAQLLDAWLVVRGRRAGPIFVAVAQGRSAKSLAPSTVREIFRKRGDQAGVPRFSPHDLRRTMIGDLLDLGEDLSTVQQVAGHASPVTTARYDRRGERAKRRAAQRLRRT
jgi:integrase